MLRGKALAEHIDHTYSLRSNLTQCAISVVTVGETYALARKLGWGAAKAETIHQLLNEVVWVDINDRRILEAYAEIDQSTEVTRQPMGQNDLWIAATARATGLVLLTTDRDFDRLHPTWINRIWVDPTIAKP